MDKEKIIRYYKSTDEDVVAARLIDIAESVEKSKKYKVSCFLSPSEIQIVEVICNSVDNIQFKIAGGFLNAERNKAIFIHNEYNFEIVDDIAALEISWDKRYYNLAHPDILGALLSLCKREFFGDIHLTDLGAQIVLDTKILQFIIQNLTRIGTAEVSLEQITLNQLEQKQEKIKKINATVATLRLDAVAAVGYGVSRTQMSENIKMQQVKLNHKPAKNSAQEVKIGDIISCRGRGRIEVTEIKGVTKKGRVSIAVNRIL